MAAVQHADGRHGAAERVQPSEQRGRALRRHGVQMPGNLQIGALSCGHMGHVSRRIFLQACSAAGLTGTGAAFGKTGGGQLVTGESQAFPEWRPGLLDLHHINTGRGNATLVVCPDGTSILIDAGAANSAEKLMNPARPDSSRRAGEWVARYARRRLRAAAREGLDYAVATHFHGDHVGEVSATSPLSVSGEYRLTGLTDVAEQMTIGRLIDRGYPAYDDPAAPQDETARNYIAFARVLAKRGAVVERIDVGSSGQIVLLHGAARYPGFSVRNLAANGGVWTGAESGGKALFPPLSTLAPEQMPSENMCSIALRISYGAFSYYTGSDLTCDTNYGADVWRDIESPVGRAAGPVSVATVNHHGYYDAAVPALVRAIRPKVWVLQAWHASHPSMQVLANLMNSQLSPGPHDVFAVGLKPEVEVTAARFAAQLRSKQGHVVVRVAEGGGEFQVLVVDDRDEENRVLGTVGPYAS